MHFEINSKAQNVHAETSPEIPRNKVKKTGHRIDCVCLKCSSILIRNLKEYLNKESKLKHQTCIKPQTVFSIGIGQNKNQQAKTNENQKPKIEKIEIQAFIGDYKCPFTYEETTSVGCIAANEEFYAIQKHDKAKNKTIDRQVFEYDDCSDLHVKSVQNSNSNVKKALLDTLPRNLKMNSRKTNFKSNHTKSEQRYKKDIKKENKSKLFKNTFTTINNFKQLHSSPISKEREPISCKAVTYDQNFGKIPRNLSEERSSSNFDVTLALSKHLNKEDMKNKSKPKQNKILTENLSHSGIFSNKDMTLHLSQTNSKKSSLKGNSSKQRKKSKPNISTITGKFNKSVLDRKLNLGTPNVSHDYISFSKNLNKSNIDSSFQSYLKDKLKNSRSSEKISKNSGISKPSYIDQYGNKMDKRFNSNTSCSKGREKPVKKLKENEFRKNFRPMHTNKTFEKLYTHQKDLNVNQFHIKLNKDIPTIENSFHQTFDDHKVISQFLKAKSDQKVKSCKSKSKLFDEKASNAIILREKCLNSIKCDLWFNNESSESKTEGIRSPPIFESCSSTTSFQNARFVNNIKITRNSSSSAKEVECNYASTDSISKQSDKKYHTKTPPPEKAVKLDDIKLHDYDVLETKDTSTKRMTTDIGYTSTDLEIKSSSSINEEPKSARDKIESQDQIEIQPSLQKKESKDTIALISKPPIGRIDLDSESPIKELRKSKVNQDNLLLDTNDEIFTLLENQDVVPDFVSSISSSSSQIDYDKMAMEAMAEVDCFDENANAKSKNLHDYRGNKWEGLYNKKGMVLDKKDNIHIIEEDIENEIDSDYSVTLKKGEREHIIHRINKEIEADKELFKLNSSKESQNLEDSISSIGSSKSKSIVDLDLYK